MLHLTGINILGSEIVLYNFKPKVKNLQRCLLFKTPVLQPFTLKILFLLTLSVCHSNSTRKLHIRIVRPWINY